MELGIHVSDFSRMGGPGGMGPALVRFVRSNLRVELFGRHLRLPQEHAYSYVTAVIKVRGQRVTVVTTHGEIIHEAPFPISNELR